MPITTRSQLHVLPEDLFRSVVRRERKRADRSDQHFALIVVQCKDCECVGCCSSCEAAIEALAVSKRRADVLGWIERERALGMILFDIPPAAPATARTLEQRVSAELGRRLDAASARRCSVQAYFHAIGSLPGEGVRQLDECPFPLCRPPKRRSGAYDRVKRALDIAGSLALLALLWPLLVLIAALVKATSRGPVLFEQTRIGEDGEPFKMLKFRTMHDGVDHRLHHEFVSGFIQSRGARNGAGERTLFKLTNDPRITTVGRVLRKTSFDELPQLWNVLRGEMSLVGPRPALPYELEQYKRWHLRRVLEAKPGITGLWQVTGRSCTTFDEMVRLDLRYARMRSLRTDLRILLATPAAVISGKGAC